MTLLKRAGLLLAMLLAVSASAAQQNPKKGTQLRTVHGQVNDKDGNAAATAVVYLKSLRTQNIQSRITDNSGNYHFNGIDPNADYEIHAEKEGLKSATRTVSSLDTRNDFLVNLKLDRKRE